MGLRRAGLAAARHGADRDADLQPIGLTDAAERPNSARCLFLLDGREAELADWSRVFDLFDGQGDAQVVAARQRWTSARAWAALTYWRQTDRGWSKG